MGIRCLQFANNWSIQIIKCLVAKAGIDFCTKAGGYY